MGFIIWGELKETYKDNYKDLAQKKKSWPVRYEMWPKVLFGYENRWSTQSTTPEPPSGVAIVKGLSLGFFFFFFFLANYLQREEKGC